MNPDLLLGALIATLAGAVTGAVLGNLAAMRRMLHLETEWAQVSFDLRKWYTSIRRARPLEIGERPLVQRPLTAAEVTERYRRMNS